MDVLSSVLTKLDVVQKEGEDGISALYCAIHRLEVDERKFVNLTSEERQFLNKTLDEWIGQDVDWEY
jgi:hypothetical protein